MARPACGGQDRENDLVYTMNRTRSEALALAHVTEGDRASCEQSVQASIELKQV